MTASSQVKENSTQEITSYESKIFVLSPDPQPKETEKKKTKIKKVNLQDLPWLGVDISMLTTPPDFKTQKFSSYERINNQSPPFGKYKPRDEDEERPLGQTVFDCFDKSPFYPKTPYLDPSKQVKPPDDPMGKTIKRTPNMIGKLQYSTTSYLRNNQRRTGTQGFLPTPIPEYDKYFTELNPYYVL